MGESKEVLFWEDHWIGEETLGRKYRRLYTISEQKQCSVIEVGGSGRRNMDFQFLVKFDVLVNRF